MALTVAQVIELLDEESSGSEIEECASFPLPHSDSSGDESPALDLNSSSGEESPSTGKNNFVFCLLTLHKQ